MSPEDVGAVVGVVGVQHHGPPPPRDPPEPPPVGGTWVELCRLAVVPAARGAGVGAALTRAVLDHARAAGADRVWLRCVQGSCAERRYRRRGWRELGLTDFPPGFDVQQGVLLWREVVPPSGAEEQEHLRGSQHPVPDPVLLDPPEVGEAAREQQPG